MPVSKFEPILYNPVKKTTLPIFIVDTAISAEIENSNYHEDIELIVAINGEGEVICNEKHIPIKKNEIFVINSNIIHHAASSTKLEFCNIGISMDFCNSFGIQLQNYYFTEKFEDELLIHKINDLKNIYYLNQNDDFYYATVCLKTLDFIIYLIKNHSSAVANIRNSKNIQYALSYIKSNFNRKLSVEEICFQTGLSRYYFLHEFKKYTGITLTNYINQLRCREACQQLETKQYSVKDVFQMSAFENFSYFSKVFKAYIGISPSEYLQNLGKDSE